MATGHEFHWLDYVVFSLVILISMVIGSISSCLGNKGKSKNDFVMGGKQMSVLPVSLSMVLTFLSAITMLGAPAEMYWFGTMFWIYSFAVLLGSGLVAQMLVPLLYPLNLISGYEYFRLRYDSHAVKILGSIFLVLSHVIYMGLATFSPATALEGAIGFPTWASIIIVGVIATVYSAIGGIQGTIWSGVFQGIIMIGTITTIVIAGAIQMGGIERVWEINEEWDRIEFFDFNPDPTVRNTFWTLVIGGSLGVMTSFGANQASIQRYCSLPTQRKAQLCLWCTFPFGLLFVTLPCLVGIIMFAYFAEKGCDPIADGIISNPNQLLPHFVMLSFAWPGFPGLFVAALFAGSLSTVAACLNAIASVTWEDFLKWKWKHLSDKKQTAVMKILIIIYGIIGTAFAFLSQFMGGHVLQAAQAFIGAASSPLLGLFLLGGIFPWANWIGAMVGGICGLIMPMWVSIGAFVLELPTEFLPIPLENCTNFVPPPFLPPPFEATGIERFYSISYMWQFGLGMITTVVVGLLVSLITGPTKASTVPKKYLIPFFDRLFCCFPEKCLGKCRCGDSDEEEDEIKIVSGNSTSNGKPTFSSQISYVPCIDDPADFVYDQPITIHEKPKAAMNSFGVSNGHAGNHAPFVVGQENPAYGTWEEDTSGRMSVHL